jgi:cytochrome c-type biogenesis protein CcmH
MATAAVVEVPLADPAQEQEARTLFRALRCAVCEGQSVADSDATLAAEMRAHIRTMVHEGKTPDEILTYFKNSYGDRILMQPPVAARTMLLWLAPLVLLIVGGRLIWRITRTGDGENHE